MPPRYTREQFIKRARRFHGDKYNYSKVEYVNSQTKVCIICPIHGEFWVTPNDHIHANVGCTKCSGNYKSNTEDFIKKATKKYGNKYDYSKVEYVNNKTKVCIICHEKDEFGNEHGEFWQRPNDHLSGYECIKCKNNYHPTTEEWVLRARQVHGDRYDYSKAKYTKALEKICIICPEHGEFWQQASNHLNGNNCPHCNSNQKSHMEENVSKMLDENNLKYFRQKTFDWLKYNRNLYLDFYLPDENIAIEVQGEQHFISIECFGGKEDFILRQKRDREKKRLCEEHNIKMFYITKRNCNLNEVINYIKNGTTSKEKWDLPKTAFKDCEEEKTNS